MTTPLTEPQRAAVTSLVEATVQIDDLIERYRSVKALEVELKSQLDQVKADLVTALHVDRTWKQVGELLEVTGSRAEQISRAAR